MKDFLELWLLIAAVRIGYAWLVWYVWPKIGGYVCWIDGPLNLIAFFVVPEQFIWAWICWATRKNELPPNEALLIPFMCRFSLCLLATSFIIALIIWRYKIHP